MNNEYRRPRTLKEKYFLGFLVTIAIEVIVGLFILFL